MKPLPFLPLFTVITGETIAERFGVEKSTYDSVPLPLLQARKGTGGGGEAGPRPTATALMACRLLDFIPDCPP